MKKKYLDTFTFNVNDYKTFKNKRRKTIKHGCKEISSSINKQSSFS